MKKFPITAIVLTLNEEKMLASCLRTLAWCNEIVIIDGGSTDQTEKISQEYKALFFVENNQSFAVRRNLGLKKASQPYIIYIDADERITPTLAQEIMVNLETKTAPVLNLMRQNIFFGQLMKAGGWQKDILPRVFDKSAITTWTGDVHESPQFLGQAKTLNSSLIHLSHRSIKDGLNKSVVWTQTEAKLLFEKNHRKVNPLTIIRKIIMEFLRRYLFKGGYKDGDVGFIEAVIQAMNKGLIYMQVWELSRQIEISNDYQRTEDNIVSAWQNEDIK